MRQVWLLHLIAALLLTAEAFGLWRYLRFRSSRGPQEAAEEDGAPGEASAAEEETPAESEPESGDAAKDAVKREGPPLPLGLALLLVPLMLYFYTVLAQDSSFLQGLMHSVLLGWLGALGYIDAKERVIPNLLILCALGFWAALILTEIFVGGMPARQVLIFCLLGGGITGVILFLVALLTKNGFGMGDVKMFTVLGLFYGLTGSYSILITSLLAMSLVSVALLFLKKATIKTSLPMAPFALFGFIITVLFGL